MRHPGKRHRNWMDTDEVAAECPECQAKRAMVSASSTVALCHEHRGPRR